MSTKDHTDNFLILRAAFRERGHEQGTEAPAAPVDVPDTLYDADELK
jgi:hypothetical protein